MRLWSLHPKYLDAKGLVALWREALLAQAVLKGETRGYTHHPQLLRFRASPAPLAAIACYLQEVYTEAERRGFRFDKTKIGRHASVEQIPVTRGQLDYEWFHLKAKLTLRAPDWLAALTSLTQPEAHPLFRVLPGPVAAWEVIQEMK